MANTLGNLSLSDMKWLGNETDPIAPLMSGQTWALRKQQAQQSADMHPLKMQEMKSSTAYRDQQTSLSAQRERHATEMNPLLQARQGIDNQNAITQGKLMSDQHALNEDTHGSRTSLMDSLAKTKQLAYDTAQKSQGDDLAIKKAQRELIGINAELAKATTGQATQARIAQLNAQRVAAENVINTQDAAVARIWADTNLAVSNATVAQATEGHRTNLAMHQSNLAGTAVQTAAHAHNRQVQADGREDASRTAHELDLDAVSAAYSVGNFAALESLTPDPTSTPAQKLAFESYKQQHTSQHDYKKWNLADKRTDHINAARDVNQRTQYGQIKDDAVHKLFTEMPAILSATSMNDPATKKPTAYGLHQFKNYNAVEKLIDGGGITQADVDKLKSAAPPTAGGPWGSTTAGLGGDYHLGGNLFIPNDENVRKLQELSAQRAAAKVSGTKTELTYRDKQTGAEIKVLPPSGQELKDKQKFEETYAAEVSAQVKALQERDEVITPEILKSIYKEVGQGIKQGSVFAEAPFVSSQDELDAARRKDPNSPTWVFDETSGKFHQAAPLSGVPAPPTGGTGAVAPGAIDPYTGQPDTAPYVAEDVFNSRKIIHEELTGAGIDPKLAQKIVWRGAKSDFGIFTDDYDADEPVSRLVGQVYKDAQGATEDALDDLLKGINAGKAIKRSILTGRTLEDKSGQAARSKKLQLLGTKLDKPTAQWPKIGGKAWTPSEAAAARKYLPIYLEAERYELELSDAVKKMPEK